MNAPTCGNPHDTRTCTLPAGHPLPHRDPLGTWVHWREYSSAEQAAMTAHLDANEGGNDRG